MTEEWSPKALPQDFRNELDVRLEAAWTAYSDASCPKCGVPWWYGRSTDNRIQFELEESTCYACAALEEKTKDKPQAPGVTPVVVPTGVKYGDGDSDPLPSIREVLGLN